MIEEKENDGIIIEYEIHRQKRERKWTDPCVLI